MTAPTTDDQTAAPTEDEPTTTDAPADEGQDDLDGRTRAGREAARYRTALRETEQQRDTLAEQVSRMQQAQVERLAADALAMPGDLLGVGGVALADLLDEAGDVDEDRVATAVAALLDKRPGLAVAHAVPSLDGGARETPRASASWSTVLGGRR